MRKLLILAVSAAIAGCNTSPSAAPAKAGARSVLAPSSVPSHRAVVAGPAPLAHEGGIVFAKPLTTIADASKQQAAALLGTELGVDLQAMRSMQDAELLASAPVSAYALLDLAFTSRTGEHTDAMGDDSPESHVSASARVDGSMGVPTPSLRPDGDLADHRASAPVSTEHADTAASGAGTGAAQHPLSDDDRQQVTRAAEDDANAAWGKLTPAQHQQAVTHSEDHDTRLRAKLADELARKAQSFRRQGDDQVSADADGNKQVTSSFAVDHADGHRDLAVTRKFEPGGSLVQTVVSLKGARSGVDLDCLRTRTDLPDGSVHVVSDARLMIDGLQHVVHWDQQVAVDGTLTGTGTITRPDGSTVTLSETGTEDGVQTITGLASASGVSIKLQTVAGSSTATATVDAGQAGSATVQVSTDDDASAAADPVATP